MDQVYPSEQLYGGKVDEGDQLQGPDEKRLAEECRRCRWGYLGVEEQSGDVVSVENKIETDLIARRYVFCIV
jgi:hypothetical protein